MKKTKFYEKTKLYFEEGLFKEIYSSDQISICNVSNTEYLAFIYDLFEDDLEIGICIKPDIILKIVEDNYLINKMYLSSSRQEKSKCTIDIKQNYKLMKEMKQKTDILGPSKNINIELEQELIEKYGKNKSR